jgi:hypothetical protein
LNPVATRVLILKKRKVLTPCHAHVCHKFAQEILCRALEQFQNLHATPLDIHINNVIVTSVSGRLLSLQHVGFNVICDDSALKAVF